MKSYYLIAGLGKTGQSIARYLSKKGQPFAAFDTRATPPDAASFTHDFPKVPLYLEDFPKEKIKTVRAIIASPGVPLDIPLMQEAQKAQIPIISDIECLARELKAPMVAITGTNGKTTVTTLVGEMAKAAGLKAAVAGNIGTPVLDLLDEDPAYDLWVLELSSFQLDLTYSLTPVAATILNITEDHLDRHHSMEAYIAAKRRIYHRAKTVLYCRNDVHTYPEDAKRSLSFGVDNPSDKDWGLLTLDEKVYLAKGSEAFFPVDALRIKGVHNWQNALAACALAELVGIDRKAVLDTLGRFSGLPHRCQWVRTLNDISWINDSKGTNVGATVSALSGIGGSMQGKIVLIAGGQGKGADFTLLASPSKSMHVRWC